MSAHNVWSVTKTQAKSALAWLMTLALVTIVLAPASFTMAAYVEPDEVAGNPQCASEMVTLKVETGENGTIVSGTYDWTTQPEVGNVNGPLQVILDLYETEDGQAFDWMSNFGVEVVIVKGGPKANVYTYLSPEHGDDSLHAPMTKSGMWADISHISFCYGLEGTVPLPPSTFTVAGLKFHDVDRDGTWDTGEATLAGWTIFVDTNLNGVWDAGEPTTITDEFGHYEFNNLPAGDYVIGEVQQEGWKQTYPVETSTTNEQVENVQTITVVDQDLSEVNFGSELEGISF